MNNDWNKQKRLGWALLKKNHPEKYEEYKKKLKEKNDEYVVCECGTRLKFGNLANHKKYPSKRHLEYLEEQGRG